jgi:hypothetical protein
VLALGCSDAPDGISPPESTPRHTLDDDSLVVDNDLLDELSNAFRRYTHGQKIRAPQKYGTGD